MLEPQPLHFNIEARPRAVPSELAALPGPTFVGYSCDIGGWRESGTVPASELRARIEATIARQAEGHYTLTEAAQTLADTRGSLPESHLARLQQGWADGGLPVHQGGSRYLRKPGEAVCTFDDTVTVADLNDWLLKHHKTGYGFPATADAGASVSAAETGGAVSRSLAQDRAILSYLSAKGHDPKKLPRNEPGKPGVKAAAKKALQGTPNFIGSRVFDKAWDRLRKNKDIVTAH
jgi:hypothetical protein